jgi:hypothetical protein
MNHLKHLKHFLRIALALAMTTTFGCSSSPKQLVGSWTLESFVDAPTAPRLPPPGRTRPTVTFEAPLPESNGEGKVTGMAGVNRFFGSYRAGSSSLAVASLGSTRMAGPAELMTLEKVFLGLVQTANSWKVKGDTLTLTGPPGSATLLRTAPDAP